MKIHFLVLILILCSCRSATIVANRTATVRNDSTTVIRTRDVHVQGAQGVGSVSIADMSSGPLTIYAPVMNSKTDTIRMNVFVQGSTATIYAECPDAVLQVSDTATSVRTDSIERETQIVTEKPGLFDNLQSMVHSFLYSIIVLIVLGVAFYVFWKKR